MSVRLPEILEATRVRVAAEMHDRPLNDLEREASGLAKPPDFPGALAAPGMSLIAEIKRSSPSAGAIRADVDPALLAKEYEEGGARALSVLTEPDYFGGSLEDLEKAVTAAGLPVLRKDFLLHPYQVVQARVAGAAAILLIIAALEDKGLYREMRQLAADLGIAALVEVHDEYELERAFDPDPQIVGVNQRNLRTFEVDTSLALRLRKEIPRGVLMVAESGIKSRAEVEELEKAEVDAILVGETLMRSERPSDAVRELLGEDGGDND